MFRVAKRKNKIIKTMNVRVENFSKSYGKVLAVDDISFEVRHGEILGFLGPNGAGKTTTMKAITTYLAPTSGKIYIGDIDVEQYPDQARRHIGYLPENNPLYPEMFVTDFLEYMARLADAPEQNISARVKEMVEICGLGDQKHKRIGELSKGYQQRVGLAQALIHDPEVLILDEPTTGLDPNQIIEIRELIKQIGKEKTVLLSSHILAEVEATCDRVVIIHKGKIVADGTAGQLREQLTQGETYLIKVANKQWFEVFDLLGKIENILSFDIVDKSKTRFKLTGKANSNFGVSIFNFAVQNSWILTELTPQEASLEDIFRQLTVDNN